MDVLVLIDKLDDLIHNAKPVPLTDQVRVDKEEIYDILDQMRATIPEEIKQARWIVKERQEMLAEAKRESERIIKEAREKPGPADLPGGGHSSGRTRRRGHHRGRSRTRARDPARRGGLRRRDPRHPRGQPHEVHRGRGPRARPARRSPRRRRRPRLKRGLTHVPRRRNKRRRTTRSASIRPGATSVATGSATWTGSATLVRRGPKSVSSCSMPGDPERARLQAKPEALVVSRSRRFG